MRRINAMVTILIMLLFFVHMIWGIMTLSGAINGGNSGFEIISYFLLACIMTHIIISSIFTARSIRAIRSSKVFYFKENKLFVLRRVSGYALVLFIACHVFIFSGYMANGVYLLRFYNSLTHTCQLLMIICLLLHLVSNIRPLTIGLGLNDKYNIKLDFAVVLSILLLISAIAFFIYFFTWLVV